jgi:hypothetical protein
MEGEIREGKLSRGVSRATVSLAGEEDTAVRGKTLEESAQYGRLPRGGGRKDVGDDADP